MEKLGDEVDFLPTHKTSNPCSDKVLTVEMHHQRVEQPLHTKDLGNNSLLRSCDVMIYEVVSGKGD
eukprot:1537738-Karenia_brevis.AAC.1